MPLSENNIDIVEIESVEEYSYIHNYNDMYLIIAVLNAKM
jgi:hypothetical protein